MFSKDDKKTKEEISQISNLIGQDTSLEGSIQSSGNIRVEGKIYGDAIAKAKFVMGSEAYVSGNVRARTAEVAGKVKGNIEISEILILKETGVIEGDILTNQLVVEPGATFNGACKMGHLAKEITIEEPESHQREVKAKRV